MFQAASDTNPQRVLPAPQRPVGSQRSSLQKVSFISTFPDRRRYGVDLALEWYLIYICRFSSVSAVVTRKIYPNWTCLTGANPFTTPEFDPVRHSVADPEYLSRVQPQSSRKL